MNRPSCETLFITWLRFKPWWDSVKSSMLLLGKQPWFMVHLQFFHCNVEVFTLHDTSFSIRRRQSTGSTQMWIHPFLYKENQKITNVPSNDFTLLVTWDNVGHIEHKLYICDDVRWCAVTVLFVYYVIIVVIMNMQVIWTVFKNDTPMWSGSQFSWSCCHLLFQVFCSWYIPVFSSHHLLWSLFKHRWGHWDANVSLHIVLMGDCVILMTWLCLSY